jgi:hypothetical protein
MLVFLPTQLPFEEYIVPHETGWELSTGDHDWFIEGVEYDSDLFLNQSSEIMVYLNLNGTTPFPTNESGWTSYSEDNYVFQATIHFENELFMWFEFGFIRHKHSMIPRLWDCDTPISLDLDCFSYLYNWSYPIGTNMYEVYDKYGRFHWAENVYFYVNVSSGDSWETFGWYRYPSLSITKTTVEEWEFTKPPPGWDDPPLCGYVPPAMRFEKYLTERNLWLVAMVAIGLWYSPNIYRIIKPKDVSKDAKTDISRTSEESAPENNSKTEEA